MKKVQRFEISGSPVPYLALKKEYDDNVKELSRRYESAKVDYIHMEIGCGSGRDAGFMFQNGYDLLAIDGSRERMKHLNLKRTS